MMHSIGRRAVIKRRPRPESAPRVSAGPSRWSHNPAFSPTRTKQSAALSTDIEFENSTAVGNADQSLFRGSPSEEVRQNPYKVVPTGELLRSLLILRSCQIPVLVKNSATLVDLSYKVLGKTVTNYAMKKTFFGHFCGGENAEEMVPLVKKLQSTGVGAIFDYAAEADVEDSVVEAWDSIEAYCEENARIAMDSVRDAANVKDGFIATKCTAMGQPALQQKLSSILTETSDLFEHIYRCSSSDPSDDRLEQRVTLEMLEKGLEALGIRASATEIRELFDRLDARRTGAIDVVDWMDGVSPKDLSFGCLTDYIQRDDSLRLSADEKQHFSSTMRRLDSIGSLAEEMGVKVLVDAEQSYLLPVCDFFALQLSKKYNQRKATIFKTYQCYMKCSFDRARLDLVRSQRHGFTLASKLVRGAYMVQERQLALATAAADPIHDTIEDTHANYDAVVEKMLRHHRHTEIMIASHNEASIQKAQALMQNLGIQRHEGGVYFAQLMGMCDHMSYDLGANGFQVFKYLPYGPVEEAMPYLLRRAQENSDIMAGASSQIELMKEELKDRYSLRRHLEKRSSVLAE